MPWTNRHMALRGTQGSLCFPWGCFLLALAVLPAALAEDPAAWGEDHVAKPLPMLADGGQCLFCHRNTIGARWETNAHQTTVRAFEADSPEAGALKAAGVAGETIAEISMVLGHDRAVRYLKPNGKYGQSALLNARWLRETGGGAADLPEGGAVWDDARFAQRCAGCHMSAVDRELVAYQASSIECYMCHGDLPTAHAENPELALFSSKGSDDPQVVTSVCAQCHIRSGESKATGRPYATHFVPGDNLFKDFGADFSPETLAAMNTNDHHVMENIRRVITGEDTSMTCMDCHSVHKSTSTRHKKLAESAYCFICHEGEDMKSGVRTAPVHSALCEY